MKLSTWAKNNNIVYQTAWNLFKAGKLPVKAYKLPTGIIVVEDDKMSRENLIKDIETFCFLNYDEEAAKNKLQECQNILK